MVSDFQYTFTYRHRDEAILVKEGGVVIAIIHRPPSLSGVEVLQRLSRCFVALHKHIEAMND